MYAKRNNEILLPDNTWNTYILGKIQQYASPAYYEKYIETQLGLRTAFVKYVSILTAVHHAFDAWLPYDVINSLYISCRGYRRIFSRDSCNRANMTTSTVISLINPRDILYKVTLSLEDGRKDGW